MNSRFALALAATVLAIGTLAWSAASASQNPPPRDGWYATNQYGVCILRRVEDTRETKLEFIFVSGLKTAAKRQQITFQVNASPAKLARPVRLSPGSDAIAPDIEVGADSDLGTVLAGVGVQKLIAYLKAGQGLDVEYSLIDGMELKLYLDTFNFPQSAAMFEACTAHVA